jgi:16S rRNA (cytosine967-C5)-methyltransferase
VLLDAPCTNTGVIRRRIDVRWRLRPKDFGQISNDQLLISRAVFRLLKPGGTLVYSTCSLEPEENEKVVRQLSTELAALSLEAEKNCLPFRDRFDGAFAAKFSVA